jgi:parvulin-like peptidyl-prolyl isomerase
LAGEKGEINMERRLFLVFLIPLVALVLSCSKSEEEVVAQLGDQPITAGTIKDEYLSITPGARPVLETIEEREQFVRDVLSKEILKLEALNAGLDNLPEVKQARQNALRRKAWEIYYDENVRSRVDVSEDELRDVYETQRYRYNLGWIFVRSRALAEELAGRIRAGEDFREIASKYSIDASRMRGGDIGTRALGTLPAGVEEMISKMKPGEVNGPLEYGGHYILVKLYDMDDSEPPDFETLRQGLISMVRTRKENALQRELAVELKREYDLQFHDDVVDMIVSKTQALYPTEADPGKIPEFSDEELARVVAEYQGGEWRVMTYVDRLKAQAEFVRPAYGVDSETIKNIVGDFVTGELWMREIETKGYDQRPEVTRAAERATEEALITMMHQQVVKDVEVDEGKLREFYEENKAELVSEARVDLAVITTQTEGEARAVYEALRAGADFAEMARERSFDQVSGAEGGKLRGSLYQRQLEAFPEVEELVEELDVNEYAEPIPMPAGFMAGEYLIVKVLGKTPSEQLDFEEIKSMLGERVLQLEQDKAFGAWLAARMGEYQVEIYPEPLSQIDFAALRE